MVRRFSAQPSRAIRQFTASAWRNFPIERYAQEVLAQMRVDDLEVTVDRDHMLRSLHNLKSLKAVLVSGPFSDTLMDSELPLGEVERLTVSNNPTLSSLNLVRRRPSIRHLIIGEESELRDISALAESQIATLQINASQLEPQDLEIILDLASLSELRLEGLPDGQHGQLPPAHPTVRRLSISSRDLQVDSLHQWVKLRGLAIWHPTLLDALFSQLTALPKLQAIQLPLRDPATELAGLPALPGIRALTLSALSGDPSFDGVGLTFPFLRRITLRLDSTTKRPFVDLTPLQGLPGLSVTIFSSISPQIRGSGAFGGRLHVKNTDSGENVMFQPSELIR